MLIDLLLFLEKRFCQYYFGFVDIILLCAEVIVERLIIVYFLVNSIMFFCTYNRFQLMCCFFYFLRLGYGDNYQP